MVSQGSPASVESLGPAARAAWEEIRLTDPDLAESAAKSWRPRCRFKAFLSMS
jgi:hypothetical protein